MPLKPLFDKEGALVGWMQPDRYIFDLEMNWRAYITSDHAWAATTGKWLGPIHLLACLDPKGRVVAWSTAGQIRSQRPQARPISAARPAPPMRMAPPPTPPPVARPAPPLGGWSTLSFAEWLAQGN